MKMSESALRQMLRDALTDIRKCQVEVERQAKRMGTEPQIIRDAEGNWPYAKLAVAKAECLHALALLQTKEG